MNKLVFGFSIPLGLAFVVGALGCAGQLTTKEQEDLCAAHVGCLNGSGGSTGAGGTGAGGTSMPLPVEMCVTTSLKSCQTAAVCHVGANPQAGLNLSNDALTKNYKALFYNKDNASSPGITKPMDMTGCVAGAFKLIDSANPMNSL